MREQTTIVVNGRKSILTRVLWLFESLSITSSKILSDTCAATAKFSSLKKKKKNFIAVVTWVKVQNFQNPELLKFKF